jgi:hypothetical protein
LLFTRPGLSRARPGTDSAIIRLGPEGLLAPPGISGRGPARKNVDTTTRNPMLLFLLFGLFLLRAAQRTLF